MPLALAPSTLVSAPPAGAPEDAGAERELEDELELGAVSFCAAGAAGVSSATVVSAVSYTGARAPCGRSHSNLMK